MTTDDDSWRTDRPRLCEALRKTEFAGQRLFAFCDKEKDHNPLPVSALARRIAWRDRAQPRSLSSRSVRIPRVKQEAIETFVLRA